MNAALRLRCLTQEDLAFADAVRAREGWNQTLSDWERFLAMAPNGCFLAEWNGRAAGTATTTVYSRDLAWVGMVLVHPEFRQRGIGRALLEHCLEHLRGCGVRCIKLDATPAGKPVYESLGFREEWTLRRWERENVAMHPTGVERSSSRSLAALDEWCELAAFDERIFGVNRQELLVALTREGCSIRCRDRDGKVTGFGLMRQGVRACYLGPIVTTETAEGVGMVEDLLQIAAAMGSRTFWDVPDCNPAAAALAERLGFKVQRQLTRMFLGDNRAPGSPECVWALAGPEVG